MITARERFLGICKFERQNDPFIWTIDAWNQTYARWKNEGMPVSNLTNRKDLNMHFIGYLNQKEVIHPNAAIMGMGPCNNPPWVPPLDPMFELTVIDSDEHTITRVDYDGCIVRVNKADPEMMPQYLEYPVKDPKSWNDFKKRLDPYSKGRFPDGWQYMSETNTDFPVKPELDGKSWEMRDFPLGMMSLSLWGMPRNYMGLEEISFAMYDNPSFVQEIIEYQAWYSLETIKQVFDAGITIDWAFIWEDMCYNKGSLVSPKFVKEVMAPHYRKVIEYLRNHGVAMVMLDCDGNTNDLLPIWVDCGVNCSYPLEAASGMNALEVRKKFGKNLMMVGNIDKRSLAAGKAEIDVQVAKVRELIKDGGYFINCDHHLSPDISYANYVYFLNEVWKLSDYEETRRHIS